VKIDRMGCWNFANAWWA